MKIGAIGMRKLTLLEAVIDCFKDNISFDDLYRALPFATDLIEGNTKTHIVSKHAFNIPLFNQNRDVREGETLCGRFGTQYAAINNYEPCPGCTAIGQGIVARELMKDFPAEYFEQKRAAKK